MSAIGKPERAPQNRVVSSVEQRREKNRVLKQSVMQELVTWKTTLVGPQESTRLARAVQEHDAGGKSRPAWPSDSAVSAVFSECQKYRYQLREIWDASKPLVLWLLMNPSVACTDYSDPTLRKTGKFSRAWGYGGQLVGNVHAYRATDKSRLLEVTDPVGPENDRMILELAAEAKTVVLA